MNLDHGEVHIWSAAIDERFEKLVERSFLSENERKRSKKFSYDIDAFIFSVRHNLLRMILSDYLQCKPVDIRFNSNRYQKPHVAHPNTPVQFNISVSSNRFVAAFCLNHIVGVDVEIVRPIEDIRTLCSDYFTPHESSWIYTHPEALLEKVFFEIWAKKESLVKAIGKGLSIELNQFDVVADHTFHMNGDTWHVTPLAVFEDCAAALTINAPTIELKYFNAENLIP